MYSNCLKVSHGKLSRMHGICYRLLVINYIKFFIFVPTTLISDAFARHSSKQRRDIKGRGTECSFT